MHDASHVMDTIRRALGREPGAHATTGAPVPPELPDSIVRMVPTGADLPAVFSKNAKELKMIVTPTSRDQAAEKLIAFLRQYPIRSIALAVSALLERLGLRAALEAAGFQVKTWDQITLDEMYGFDCAVTDVDYAVAESGTIVIKPTAKQGRSMSLVPMYHVAFIEPHQFLPDMVDLFDKLARDPDRSNVVLISGPSKTADIEMNVVTGVHGPNVVNSFVLG